MDSKTHVFGLLGSVAADQDAWQLRDAELYHHLFVSEDRDPRLATRWFAADDMRPAARTSTGKHGHPDGDRLVLPRREIWRWVDAALLRSTFLADLKDFARCVRS
jgi:hypothetical protein